MNTGIESVESLLRFAVGISGRLARHRRIDPEECEGLAGLSVAEVLAEGSGGGRAAVVRRLRDHLYAYQVRESRYERVADGYFESLRDVGRRHRTGGLTASEEASVLANRSLGLSAGRIADVTGLPLWKVSLSAGRQRVRLRAAALKAALIGEAA